MKKVLILGSGCAKCMKLYAQVDAAIKELGIECDLEKVEDIQEFIKYGVMMTPALVVDGEVKMSGRIPGLDELKTMLE